MKRINKIFRYKFSSFFGRLNYFFLGREQMNLGERIKKLQKINNYSLRELASKVGISHTFLSDIENNRSNPSLKRLQDIAAGLNVNVSFLLGEKDEMDNWLTDEDFISLYSKFHKNPDLRKVMEKVNKLDSKQIKDLDKYISYEFKLDD
jgi:transcriptional regulator with XRE-family HTH domain